MNVILGAGGFAREVAWLAHDLVRSGHADRAIDAFVADDHAENLGTSIRGIEVISESKFFDTCKSVPVNIYIGVGSPRLKEMLYKKCLSYLELAHFPHLVHPSVAMDLRSGAIELGEGCIVCAGTILTTDLRIGAFAHVNLDCTVGHDADIGRFSTLSPGVHVSGRVIFGERCFVGTGATFLENVRIVDDTVIGAGATVVKSITSAGTYVGTPARLLA